MTVNAWQFERIWSLALLGALFSVGCRGKVDEEPPTPPPLLPLDEAAFFPALTRAVCDGVQPCCQAMGWVLADDCDEALADSKFARSMIRLRDLGQPYDPLQARRCVEDSRALVEQQIKACEQGSSLPSDFVREVAESCLVGVYRGLEPTAPCQNDAECAPPPEGGLNRCIPPMGCVQLLLAGDGEVCDPGNLPVKRICDSRARFYCNSETSRCQRFRPEGSSCSPAQDDCDPELECEQGQCVRFSRAEGEPCKSGVGCASDLVCLPVTPLEEVCQVPLPEGSLCGDHLTGLCQSNICFDFRCLVKRVLFLPSCQPP